MDKYVENLLWITQLIQAVEVEERILEKYRRSLEDTSSKLRPFTLDVELDINKLELDTSFPKERDQTSWYSHWYPVQ
ncbi:hypothetical protein, partial [Pseudomonas sp. 2822-17]|uniref:hypothetical protein n=1 Tax=Pseudomonas sp. 2822-17 TaxID=1712678 RepID=UPI001C45D3AC